MSDSRAQASWEAFPISRWPTMQAHRPAEGERPSRATRSRWAPFARRLVTLLALVPAISACTSDLSCSGSDVQAALHQALDNLYAQSRTISRIELTIKDVVSIGKTEYGVSCKALVHLDVNYLEIAQSADPVILYTTERTDNGRVLVTSSP